jgi:hypothetical protein
MKIALVIGVLIASLGGCAIVPVDHGYRADRSYSHYGGDGYYYGDRYYRADRYYRSYSYYSYRDHGQ